LKISVAKISIAKIDVVKGMTFSIVRPFRSCGYKLCSRTGHRPAVM